MTVTELIEWQAYDQLEPFGEGRLVLQMAMAMRMQLRGDPKLTDLVPYYLEPLLAASEPDENQQRQVSERLAAYFQRRFGARPKPNGEMKSDG